MTITQVSRALLCVALVGSAMISSGCQSPAPALPGNLQAAADRMDRVERRLDEYGTVTISSPLLARPDRQRFGFDLNRSAEDYFKEDKSEFQGRAVELEQILQSLSVGASVAVDPTQAAAFAVQVQEHFQARAQEARRQAILDQQLALKNQLAQQDHQRDLAAAEAKREAARAAAAKETDPAVKQQKMADAEAAYAADVTAANDKFTKALQAPDKTDVPAMPTSANFQPKEASPDLTKDTGDLQNRAGLTKFAGAGALAANASKPTLSNRSAIITASGDRATQAIFNVLGDPELSSRFTGKKTVFGVSMVSVNPGWRTRKGYAADIAVTAHYTYAPARPAVVELFLKDPRIAPGLRARVAHDAGLADRAELGAASDGNAVPLNMALPELDDQFYNVPKGGASPLVAAVSPMTETQALDLQSSSRRQDEFALNLAFAMQSAGLNAQARLLEQFVHSRQTDAATATPSVAVNAYSHSGGMYGFQVGPRLVAIERVRKIKVAGPAEVLDRQSFPALILYGLDSGDLLRIKAEPDVDHLGRANFVLYEARLLLLTAPTWMPVDEGARCARLSEADRLRTSIDLTLADTAVSAGAQGDSAQDDSAKRADKLAKNRIRMLQFKANGSGQIQSLPLDVFDPTPPPPPEGVDSARSGQGPATAPTTPTPPGRTATPPATSPPRPAGG